VIRYPDWPLPRMSAMRSEIELPWS